MRTRADRRHAQRCDVFSARWRADASTRYGAQRHDMAAMRENGAVMSARDVVYAERVCVRYFMRIVAHTAKALCARKDNKSDMMCSAAPRYDALPA